MMRAWENRTDTTVIDEPFYPHFLDHTGLDHPMADQVIANGETDWRAVIRHISQVPDQGVFYQKHITTHWLSHYSTDWLDKLAHIFLIRHPAPVVASYADKRAALTLFDLGYEQQLFLFDLISDKKGKEPLVLDSFRFLQQPEQQLRLVCESLGIPFESRMLHWPPGARDSDGLWGAHWYDAVNQSTGFSQARTGLPELNEQQQSVADACQPSYQRLLKYAVELH